MGDSLADRAGRLAAGLVPGIGRQAVAHAAQVEKVLLHAHAVGLGDDDAREVIRTWSVWYQQTPWPLPWDRVREAMTHRAMGDEWRPPLPLGATVLRGRMFEHDQLRPAPGDYFGRLVADLPTVAPGLLPAPTLADL